MIFFSPTIVLPCDCLEGQTCVHCYEHEDDEFEPLIDIDEAPTPCYE